MEKRNLKPYVGIILVVLYVIGSVVVGTVLGREPGLLGTSIQELLLLLTAVGVVFFFRGDLKRVFPIRRPSASGVLGTLILCLGAYLATTRLTMIMSQLFPEQVLGENQEVVDMIISAPFLISLLMLSVIPAICEEMAFRGALLSSFRGFRSKWTIIILVSAIYGAFSGSIWSFAPLFLLGIGMGYLMLETENIVYCMLFSMVNSGVRITMTFAMNKVDDIMGVSNTLDAQVAAVTLLPLTYVANFLMYGGAVPILIYIGNHLLHRGQPGYDRGVFPREKRNLMIGLVAIAVASLFLGTILFAVEMSGAMKQVLF